MGLLSGIAAFLIRAGYDAPIFGQAEKNESEFTARLVHDIIDMSKRGVGTGKIAKALRINQVTVARVLRQKREMEMRGSELERDMKRKADQTFAARRKQEIAIVEAAAQTAFPEAKIETSITDGPDDTKRD